jgi:hypothetical protein
MSIIEYETKAGDPIQAGDVQIIPFAKVFHLRLPGQRGGLVWNRPVAVAVTPLNGETYVLPVRDPTRMALFAMGGAILGGLLLTSFIQIRKRRKPND